jgi:MoaA/NifB/PqqE/SkfB family radical SAM enzyme
MCDIWKANSDKKEISTEALAMHLNAFKKLGVKRVALSGGEALMHSNLWKFCEQLNSIGAKISLLSTGLTLKAHASNIIAHCDDLIVSLDGSREIHNRIRNIPGAYEKLAEGIQAIKKINPSFRITGRTVLQKMNFRDFENMIESAKALGLDQISFLAADVSSSAFNRESPWENQHVSEVALTKEEVTEFKKILTEGLSKFKTYFESKFIAESPSKLMDLASYYGALLGEVKFPEKKCNAPWVSSVIESDGQVRPCFFHPSYGNIFDNDFESILNSQKAIDFRKNLKINKDPVCQKCVCSLHISPLQSV